MDASKTGLVIKEQTMTQEINLTSDLALYQATQRRVLAMDLTNLASYEKKKWMDRVFAIFAQPAAPGFQKVFQAQLLRADCQRGLTKEAQKKKRIQNRRTRRGSANEMPRNASLSHETRIPKN